MSSTVKSRQVSYMACNSYTKSDINAYHLHQNTHQRIFYL